ncbi:josephin-like protein [Rosa sericea]|uniref:Josephin-like protein n=1 Tax=Rosa chinensis TaxID=74649 RepID=A0A2P6R986_ROSCH|nr:josephin-like protein [Rosa rugosa]PRQ42998.1 hypothetical protein RchiOBHm_Chr3g0463681 [Rosa chinensis]
MSRQSSKRVSFSPDVYDNKPIMYLKQSGGTRVGGNRNMASGIWAFRQLNDTNSLSAPVRFLRGLRAKVARVISARKRSSRKVSSSNLTRSRSVSDPIESHRAEALEDCIEFLNSASSLQRTSSVTSNC